MNREKGSRCAEGSLWVPGRCAQHPPEPPALRGRDPRSRSQPEVGKCPFLPKFAPKTSGAGRARRSGAAAGGSPRPARLGPAELLGKQGGKSSVAAFSLSTSFSRRHRTQRQQAEEQAEHKTGSGLEVHPYNIYYWRRMNHFPIYGPLTVEGGEISLTRRNIYVVLRDVLTGWQRCRQGLPAPCSAPGDRPAHVCPQHHAAPQLILSVSSAPQHKGGNPTRTPSSPPAGC